MAMASSAKKDQQVAVVIGGSRGIGRQIAIDLAKANYFVIVTGKTASPVDPSRFPPDPNSPESTINTVCKEITDLGLSAAAITVDTRSYASIQALFGQLSRLDVLVYNSGAVWWAPVEGTPMKRFRLMQQVNIEGFYGCVQEALPLFKRQGWRGRIVAVAPPIYSRFFRGKTAYAAGKVGMSVLVKGLAMDWEREAEAKKAMAVTAVWPATSIESAATKAFSDRNPEELKDLRDATVFSDAVMAIIDTPPPQVNGLLTTDEDFLREYKGVTDFAKYSKVPGAVPRRIMPKSFPDLRVAEHDDEGKRVDSTVLRGSKL